MLYMISKASFGSDQSKLFVNNLDKKRVKRVFFTLRMQKNTVKIAAYKAYIRV